MTQIQDVPSNNTITTDFNGVAHNTDYASIANDLFGGDTNSEEQSDVETVSASSEEIPETTVDSIEQQEEQTETEDKIDPAKLSNQHAAATRRILKAEKLEQKVHKLHAQIEERASAIRQAEQILTSDPLKLLDHVASIKGTTKDNVLREIISAIHPEFKEEVKVDPTVKALQDEINSLKSRLDQEPKIKEQEKIQQGVQLWKQSIGQNVENDLYPGLSLMEPKALADAAERVFVQAYNNGHSPSDSEILEFLNSQVMSDYNRLNSRLQPKQPEQKPKKQITSALTNRQVSSVPSSVPKTQYQLQQDAIEFLRSLDNE